MCFYPDAQQSQASVENIYELAWMKYFSSVLTCCSYLISFDQIQPPQSPFVTPSGLES